jgi:adenylate cyclase
MPDDNGTDSRNSQRERQGEGLVGAAGRLIPHLLPEKLPGLPQLPGRLHSLPERLPGFPFKLARGTSSSPRPVFPEGGGADPQGAAEPQLALGASPEQPGTDLDRVQPTVDDLVALIVGAPRKYTVPEVVEPAGVTVEEARQFWRALGLADVGDARALTDIDVRIFDGFLSLIRSGRLTEDFAIKVVRSVGQTVARLADWHVTMMQEHFESAEVPVAAQTAVAYDIAEQLMPDLEHLLVYTWRRHLAVAAARLTQAAEDEEMVRSRLAVGFADLVGFTRLSRRMEEEALGRLVETFESGSADLVTALGGRVVKMLGDEVMFAAGTPEVAAEIGLQLVETMAADESIPELRVGIAIGTVVTRMGDVYGTTVNMASRLTSLAPRNSVVVDSEMAHALAGNPKYQVGTMWRRPVRGFGLVAPSVLMRRPILRG